MPRKRKKEVSSTTPSRKQNLESKLIENIIELQRVHTNLIEKFDKLSSQISGLLSLFEMTAKNFGENIVNPVTQKDKEFLDKIDKLLEQNKTIAKGLILMEDRMKEKVYGVQKPAEQPRQAYPPNQAYQPAPEEEFQPSMSNASGRQMPRF